MCAQQTYYSFDDIFLIPQYSELSSRSEVDTSCFYGNLKLKIPIISAAMSTVSENEMAVSMFLNGALSALHRFCSIEENVRQYRSVRKMNAECITSIGVKDSEKNRFAALYESGARYFNIDVSHAHSLKMKNMLEWIKNNFKDTFICAGNVATPEAVKDLEEWGSDVIKIGISPGSTCETRAVSGHGIPQFSAILNCAAEAKAPLVADGGIRNSGDVVKALCAGASYVMCGNLFAGTDEAPGRIIVENGFKYKEFYGMASNEAIFKTKKPDEFRPAAEGISTKIKTKGPVKYILENLKKGIQSGMSYCSATTIDQIHLKARWGVQTNNGLKEGNPHILETK